MCIQWLQQFVYPVLSLEVQQPDNQVHTTICDAFLDPTLKGLAECTGAQGLCPYAR